MLRRHWGLLTTAAVFAAGSAGAQTAQQADLDKIEQMQRQMQQLQEQMKQVKSELIEAKRKAAEVKAAEQKSEIPPAFNGAYGADLKPFPTKAPSILDRVKLTWGGFLAAEAVYRQHSAVSDLGTPFDGIPYPFSPLYGEGEFRGSARQSRLSLLVEGALTPAQKLSGYYEMDFLGVGVTSNYNQSNSWAPRLRQAFFEYDNNDWGFHFLAGQAWSLLTQNTVGITARKENTPLVIDPNYVAGFDYARSWQVRFVQDWGTWASFGVSVEAPAEIVYGSTGAVSCSFPAGTGAPAPAPGTGCGNINGWAVNFSNAAQSGPPSGFLGSGAYGNPFTTDEIPDIIAKAAFDPGWGHYEVFGLQRFFTDNVYRCAIAQTPAGATGAGGQTVGLCDTTIANNVAGPQHVRITTGEGIGGSVLLPIWPKFIDVQASALYGKGIGRYGASSLSDVVVGPDGSLVPITAVHFLGGVIVHPWVGLDVYAYAGTEKAQANYWSIVSTGSVLGLTGFGVPSANNTGCYITTLNSFTGGANNCNAINHQITSVAAGFWQDMYKGPMGRVAAGLQYEWVRREAFAGYGPSTGLAFGATLTPPGSVRTDDQAVFASLRYYPF
jgi:hypothetical protein